MSAKEAHELKQLQTREKKALAELESLKNQLDDLHKLIDTSTSNLTSIRKQIKSHKDRAKDPIVSEHAILRYLEYIEGIDLDEIRKNILNNKSMEQTKTLGAGKYPLAGHNGYRFVFKDNTIITIINEKA